MTRRDDEGVVVALGPTGGTGADDTTTRNRSNQQQRLALHTCDRRLDCVVLVRETR